MNTPTYPPPPRHRPHWWPENESWPPRGRLRHRPFFRRVGCLFGMLPLFGFGLLLALALVGAGSLGLVHVRPDFLQWAIPIAVGAAVFLALAVSLGGMRLRRIFVPLDDLLEASGRVAQGDYSARVTEKGPPEVRSLARAFNEMAARLGKVDEQRRDMLADATHELRTPLTVLQGNLEGLLDGIYPPDEAHLRALLEETHIMERLIEDLRTLALAESGALQLKKESLDLDQLNRDVQAAFQAQAAAAGVTLHYVAIGQIPILMADPGRIRQVLVNLLANALHYTPAGGEIALRCRADGENVILEVQDSGPGIAPADLPHVFERFYKSADSGGMGLGLAIAKHLVEAHGGQIRAESTPGRGTTIQFTLKTEFPE